MRRPAAVALAVLLALVLLAVGLLAGCSASHQTRKASDRLAGILGHPSWTTGVDVGSGRDGEGVSEYVATVVSLKASATPDQVADFVTAMPTAVRKAGLQDGANYRQLTFVDSFGARLNIGWTATVDRTAVRSGVEEWFGVGARFRGGTSATLLTSGETSYVVDLGDGGRDRVAAAYGDLAAIALPTSSWEVRATAGDEQLDLTSAALPTRGQLRLWSLLLDGQGALPAPLEGSRLDLNFEGDRTVADLAFTVPNSLAPDQITIADWGGRLWPELRPELAAMAGLNAPWSYFASVAPRNDPGSESFLISLLSDQATVDDGDESSRWSKAAQLYIQSLRGT